MENTPDITLPGPGISWDFGRALTLAGTTGNYHQGKKWVNSPVSVFLYPSGTSRVLEAPGGVIHPFHWDTMTSKFMPRPDSYLDLSVAMSGDYILTDLTNNMRWVFDSNLKAGGYLLKEITSEQLTQSGKSGYILSYHTDGRLNQVTGPTGQDYVITYGWNGNRIISVAFADASSNPIARVDYKYYQDVSGGVSADLGAADDLVQVKVSQRATKDTGSTLSIVRYTQYRYFYLSKPTGGYSSNLKAVYEHDAIQRAMAANSLSTPDDLLTKADNYGSPALRNYASRSFTYYTANEDTSSINTAFQANEDLETTYGGLEDFEYSSSGYETLRVKSETIGGCGTCGTTGSLTKSYYYMGVTNSTTDQNQVTRLVIEDIQDATGNALRRTVYGFQGSYGNHVSGGRMLRRATIVDPVGTPQYFCESWTFDTTTLPFREAEHRYPSAHTVVNSASALRTFLNPYNGSSWANDSSTLNASAGLIEAHSYNSEGLRTDSWVKNGSGGTPYYVWAADYAEGTNDYLVTSEYDYPTQTTTRASGIATSYSYTFHDASTHKQIKTKTTTLPIISSGQNGSGVATTTEEYFDGAGRLTWTKDGEGYINYYAYHPATGVLAYTAIDVDPASASSEISSGSSGNWEAWTVYGADANKPTRPTLPTVLNLVSKTYYDKLGRVTQTTSPGGASHFTAYENLRTISFPYWDGTNTKTLLPTRISLLNSATQLIEEIAVKASYTAFSTASGAPTGFSTDPSQSDYVEWTRHTYDSTTGQFNHTDRYANIPSSGTGTLSTDFYRSLVQLDSFNRKEYEIQVVSGSTAADRKEQVMKYVYDAMGRVIEVKRGVSGDSAANSHNMTDSYSSYPTLATISKTEYDEGGVGDGHITKTKDYFGTGTNDYTGTNLKRTYRGHVRGIEPYYMASTTETTTGPYTVQDVDWMGRVTTDALYDTTPVWGTVLTGDSYTAYASSTTTNRRARTDILYDYLGRFYQTKVYEVASSNGTGNNFSTAAHYYDRNNRIVGTVKNLQEGEELAYDGAGRQYQSRKVTELDSSLYSSGKFVYQNPTPNPSLNSMSGGDDSVVTMSHSVLNAEGNITDLHEFEATHDDLLGGSVGFDFSNNDDYIRETNYQWYDAADRSTTTADYGSGDTSGGAGEWMYFTVPSKPGSAPSSSSSTVLVITQSYNTDSGLPEIATDTTAVKTKTFYDNLKRPLYVAENWTDFTGAAETSTGDGSDKSKDRVTKRVYDGLDNLSQLIAMDLNGDGMLSDNQVTTYLFEDGNNARLVTSEIYPDSSDTTSSGTDQVKKAYNVDGTLSQEIDQRGRVLDYSFTNNRQLETSSVTTLGSGVDGAIRSIKRTYDNLSRLQNVTSYSGTAASGSVVNDVQTEYDDFGAIKASYQAHAGAVNSMSTLQVQYGYDTTTSGNVFTNQRRLQSVTYPNGRVIFHDYDVGAGGASSKLSMIRKIRETNASGTELAIYDYLGSGKMAVADLPQPDIKLDYFQGTSGTYAGWDRFGRIKDQYWDGYGMTTDVDRFKYEYDQAGSRTSRDIDSAIYASNDRDQAYTYDDLHRLKTCKDGTLSSGSIIGTPTKEEDWELDAQGNWEGYLTKTSGSTDLDQLRSMNAANEITNTTETSGPSWANPVFDNAGNMISIPKPSNLTGVYTATYDAWNRLVKIEDGMAIAAEYVYDGENRQIVKNVYSGSSLSYKEHSYYNTQWQAIEVRKEISNIEDTDPVEQFVWHPLYIDTPILRDYDVSTSGNQIRHYYAFDGNFNVTGLMDSSGAVVERYHYTPFGQVTVLDSNFAVDLDGSSDLSNSVMYTGRRFDIESGLFYYRNRYYHSQLGEFISRDPAGYEDGLNVYLYAQANPTTFVDPSGTTTIVCHCNCWGNTSPNQGWNVTVNCTTSGLKCCKKACIKPKHCGPPFVVDWWIKKCEKKYLCYKACDINNSNCEAWARAMALIGIAGCYKIPFPRMVLACLWKNHQNLQFKLDKCKRDYDACYKKCSTL